MHSRAIALLRGRTQRLEHRHLLRAHRLGVERGGRLHGHHGEHLQHVVLQHVRERAGLVVVGGPAALHAQLLGHGDLDQLDVLPVPQRLEDGVVEAEPEDVLDRLFSEVVIDPVDLELAQVVVQVLVELHRALQVVAEGLLDHHPAPHLLVAFLRVEQAGLRQAGDGVGEERGLEREVEEAARLACRRAARRGAPRGASRRRPR